MDLLHAPVRADNDPQSHCALQLLQASCVGIVRVRVVDSSWHGHPASSRHGILAYRHALTGANAAATSLTNTATLSGTIGGLTEDAMEWISYGFVVRFKPTAHFPSIQFRHADIQNNQIRPIFLYLFQSFHTVISRHNLKSAEFQAIL